MNQDKQQAFAQALRDCAAEPIHQMGHIQPHGALLVLSDAQPPVVLQASDNLAMFIELPAAGVLGKSLPALFGEAATRQVERLMAVARVETTTLGNVCFHSGAASVACRAYVYRSADCFVLELEPDDADPLAGQLAEHLLTLQKSLLSPEVIEHVTVYFDRVVMVLRQLTGYDSVMVYRFDADWNGEVISQNHVENSPSYLGLHFPASDIPPQARKLYTENLVRVVADVDARPVAVLPVLNPLSGQPLDMTCSILRSLSPIHIEYLRNMGIQASMVISLLQNDRLWGLIVCHHMTPRRVSIAMREVGVFVSRITTAKLTAIDAMAQRQHADKALRMTGELLKLISGAPEPAIFQRLLQDLLSLLNATGIIVTVAGERYMHGQLPDDEHITQLLAWLGQQEAAAIFSCDDLPQRCPAAAAFGGVAAGVMATPLSEKMDNAIIWLREEKTRSIHWAGKYQDGLVQNASGDFQLTPRKSFAVWTELWRGRSAPWTEVETGIVVMLARVLTEALVQKKQREQHAQKRREADEQLLRAASIKQHQDGELIRKLLLAVEQSSNSIMITDMDARIEYVNDAFIHITGYSREEVIGRNPRFLKSGITPQSTYDGLWAMLVSGQAWRGELFNTRKDGTTYIESGLISPIRQPDGRITHYLGIKEDITARKETEQALLQAKAAAEMLAQSKAEFLANMSHEIRTPMNAIIGLSQLALNKDLPDEVRDYLEKIYSSSGSLLGILNDILDFSKLEAGKFGIEKAPFNLIQLFGALHNLFGVRAEEKQLEFSIEADSDIPTQLLGDALRIQQILANLLGNAIKFTARGRVVLRLQLLSLEPTEVAVRFSISDTGIGISQEDQRRLFQSFNQLDASITRRFGGSGLGLAISRGLLQLMGSDLSVTSVPDVGSTFSFDLTLGVSSVIPKRQAERGLDNQQAHGLSANLREQAKRLLGVPVLVAEDNLINQQVVTEFLKLAGVRVDVASNGLEALQRLDDHDYQAILMDVHMPEMGGVEATTRIRQQTRYARLPIIALTAGVTPEEHARCLACGMSDFVAKPVNPEQLITMLLRWIPDPASGSVVVSDEPAPLGAPAAPLGPEGGLTLPGFDLVLARKRLGDDAELVMDVLHQFHQTLAQDVELIESLIANRQWQLAADQVHSLKSAADYLGALALREVCEAVAAQLQRGGIEPAIHERWQKQVQETQSALALLA